MSRVLVTGANGFIGSHLTDALLERGDQVVAADLARGPDSNLLKASEKPGFSYRRCDTTRLSSVRRLFALRPDAVAHAAAGVGVKSYMAAAMNTIESNVIGTYNAVQEAMRGKTRFLYLSSSEVFGRNPTLPWTETSDRVLGDPSLSRWSYSTSKGLCEHIVNAAHDQFGLVTSIVRPFNIYGPRQRADFVISISLHRVLNGLPPIIYGDGQQTRCFTYIDDLVDGLLKCLDQEAAIGETFNMGSPREWSIRDVIQMVSRAVGSNLAPEYKDPKLVFGSGFDEVARRRVDNSKAARLLGWSPRTEIADGIAKTVAWARSHPEWLRTP